LASSFIKGKLFQIKGPLSLEGCQMILQAARAFI
jgi:hypothetical protein